MRGACSRFRAATAHAKAPASWTHSKRFANTEENYVGCEDLFRQQYQIDTDKIFAGEPDLETERRGREILQLDLSAPAFLSSA